MGNPERRAPKGTLSETRLGGRSLPRIHRNGQAAVTPGIQTLFERRRSHCADLDIAQRILQRYDQYVPRKKQADRPQYVANSFKHAHLPSFSPIWHLGLMLVFLKRT